MDIKKEQIMPTQVRIAADILFREVGDEAVLLDLKRTYYYGLNDVGVRIWQLLTDGLDTGAVVQQLVSEYNVAESELRQDVAELLADMIQAELIYVEEMA